MKPIVSTALALSAIAGAVVSTGAAAPGRQPPTASVFTSEQAATGKAIFTKTCASCHLADLTGNDDAPALVGPPFRNIWKTRSIKELLDYVSGAMPPGGSTLEAEDYAAIVGYILERNGASAGRDRLTATTSVAIGSVVK